MLRVKSRMAKHMEKREREVRIKKAMHEAVKLPDGKRKISIRAAAA